MHDGDMNMYVKHHNANYLLCFTYNQNDKKSLFCVYLDLDNYSYK